MSEEKIYGSKNAPLKVQIISDTHYYSRTCGTEGKAYKKAESKSQKVIKDSDLVINAAWDMLCKDTSTDIVLLSGDTTKDGEIASHKEFIEKLRELKSRGKRVYVITSTHDYQDDGLTDGYKGDEKIKVPAATRDMLWDMYYEFGPNEAISYHLPSMSYVVQLCDGYRLFALNDDRNTDDNGKAKSGFSESCKKWIYEQIEDAQKNDQYIIAMTHHPMLAPSPFYAIIGKGDLQRDHLKNVEEFADRGINCVFTGHTHIHDISYRRTEKGNIFYDVSTASLIGYPPTMRTAVFDPANEKITVETQFIEQVPGLDTDGKSFPEYIKNFFIGMIGEVLWAAGNDIDRLAEMTDAFSVPGEKVKKLKFVIKPIGKFLNSLTIGKVGKWTKAETSLKPEDYEDIKDKKVIDFMLEAVTNLYGGDAPYGPDTREYKIAMGLLSIIDSFLDTIGLKIGKLLKGAENASSLVEPLFYNSGICDEKAELKIFPVYREKNPNPELIEEEKKSKSETTVKKSKKGPWILAALIVLVILLIAVVLGIIGLVVWGIVSLIQLLIPGTILPFFPGLF